MKLNGLTRAPVLVALVIATAALFAMVSGCKPDADAAQEVADADAGEVDEVTDADAAQVDEVADADAGQVDEVADADTGQVEEVADADTGQVEEDTDPDAGRIIEGTTANFKSAVLQSELPVLVDFGADWCAPCRGIHPNLVAIAAEYSGRCKVVSVDVDKAGALAQKYGVRAIPTLVVIVDGRKADGGLGYQTVPQLRTLLDKHVK